MKERESVEKEIFYAVMNSSGELKEGKFSCNAGLLKTDKAFAFIPEELKEVGGKVYLVGLFDYNKKGTQVALFTIEGQ